MIINLEKPYLLGLNDSFNGRQLPLNIGKTLLGRDESQCQIVFGQAFISRLQAVLEVLPDGQVLLINLSSKQTTFVNGRIVSSQILNNGDRIEFGAGQLVSFQFHQPILNCETCSILKTVVAVGGSAAMVSGPIGAWWTKGAGE